MSGKWLIRLIYVFVFADPEPAIINIPHGWLEICGKFGLYSNCNIIKVNRFYAMLLYCYTQYHLFYILGLCSFKVLMFLLNILNVWFYNYQHSIQSY